MPKVALSKFHMPKFQLTKFHMPKVLYAKIPIAKIHWSRREAKKRGIKIDNNNFSPKNLVLLNACKNVESSWNPVDFFGIQM